MRNQELLPIRIAFIRRIVDLNQDIGKTKIQKITYFLQKSVGVELKYPFRMHYYGPYSDQLDNALSWASALGYIEIHPDPDGFGYHVIPSSSKGPGLESDYKIEDHPKLTQIDNAIDILGNLETSDLELYATIHLIGGPDSEQTKEATLSAVKKLKPKFNEEKIASAYQSLENARLI